MRFTSHNFFIASIIAAILFVPRLAWANACSSVTGTVLWNSAASWTSCGSTTPQTADTVTIINNSNVTVDADHTIAGLSFAGGANANSLNLNGKALTITGTLTMTQPTGSVTSSLLINQGTVTVSGLTTLTGNNTTTTRVSKITITSGQLNANGGVTFGGTNGANLTKVIDMSGGAGTLNLKGALTFTVVGTLTAGSSSSFNYADTAAQTVRMFAGGAYNDLLINNTNASGATLSAAITATNVTGAIRVQSGTLKNGGFAIAGNASKEFEVADGAAFEMSAGNFPTGFGTFTFGNTSTVRYLQGTALTLSSYIYGNLELKPTATRTFTFPAGAFVVNGNLVIGNGSNACTAQANTNATILAVGGDLTIAASSVFSANASNATTVGGSWTKTGTFTNNSGTVIFNGTSAGTLSGTMTGTTGRFYNVEFDGVGGVWTNTGAVEANNNFTITNGTFSAGAAITVTGNWTNDDTFVNNNQTVTLNSTASGKTLSGNLSGTNGKFFNLIFNGSGGGWSPSSFMVVAGTMTMTAGTLSGTSDITVNAGVAGTAGIITLTGGTFTFRVGTLGTFGTTSGTNNWTFNNLWLSNSSGSNQTVRFNLGGTGQIVVNGVLTIGDDNDAAVTILDDETNDRIINANGDVIITTQGSLTASSTQVLSVGGSYVNNGVFTSGAGSTTFDSTVGGNHISGNMTGSNSFNTVTFNGTGGGWSVDSAVEIDGNLTVTAGTVSGTADMTVVGAVAGSGTNGWITMTGGTFNHRVAAAQTFGTNVAGANDWTFYNLIFSNGSATNRIITPNTTGTGSILVTNDLTIGDAADTNTTTLADVTNDRRITVGGTVTTIAAKGVLQASDLVPLTVGESFINNGTFTSNNGTVTFNASTLGHTLSGTLAFGALIFDGVGGGWTAASPISVTRGITLQNGTLNDGGFQIAGNATYNLVIGSGAELVLGSDSSATVFPTLFTTAKTFINSASTVTYHAGVAQNVMGTSIYGNLRIDSNSNSPTKTLLAATTVSGNVSIGSGNTLSVGGSNFPLAIGRNFDNQGSFEANAGTVTFNGTSAALISGGFMGASEFNHVVINGVGGSWNVSAPIEIGGNLTLTAGALKGSSDVTVNGNVLGNGATGELNFTGGTFQQRVAANQTFGTNGSDPMNWTFNNLKFSNSSVVARNVTTNASGSGALIVNGDFTVGSASDINTTTLDNQTNSRALTLNGNVAITGSGILQTSASSPLVIRGNWTNGGTFTHNSSTVVFTSAGGQVVDNGGQAFANIVSSNTSAAGLTFSDRFSADQLTLKTSVLGLPATIYFASNETFNINQLTLTGTSSSPITLKPTTSNVAWNLNVPTPQTVRYVQVSYSNASSGQTVTDYPGGVDGGGNSNWAMAVTAPANLQITAAQTSSLSASWSVSPYSADDYTLQLSTVSDFTGTTLSSITKNLSGTVTGLGINTTYYTRLRSTLSGSPSAWSTAIASATLANAPATAATTWTYVGYSSASIAWDANANPSGTGYEVTLSTASDFSSPDNVVQNETTVSSLFTGLDFGTTYYARVRSNNYSGIYSAYTSLGSTQTQSPTTCNASTTGNWSTPGTWSGCTGVGGLPALTDLITVNSGVVVTLDQDATVAGLTFAANSVNSALTHSGNFALMITGPVVLSQPTTNSRSNSWNINAGSATVTGSISFNGASTTTTRISQIVITTGQLNALNGISFQGATAATKLIDMTGGAGTVNLQGNLTFAGASATLNSSATSIFNYNDNVSAQAVQFFSAGSYNHLYFNNTSAGGATLAANKTATNATGDLQVQSGLLKNGGFAITGDTGHSFTVSNGATFAMSGTSAFPASYTTYTFGSNSTVQYLQTTSPLTLTAESYGNLELKSAGPATQIFPAGAFSVAGNLTIGDGTNFTVGSSSFNSTNLVVGGSVYVAQRSTFVAHASNTLRVGGNWTNQGTFKANGGTAIFASTNTQAVHHGGQSFSTIIASNSSSGGLTFSSSFTATQLTVNTSLLNSAATIYFSASTVTVTNLTLAGTATYPLTLAPATPSTSWYLNNTSTHTVHHVQVSYSNATGKRIWNYPGGVDSESNINWAIGLAAPSNLQFSAATATSLTGSWQAPDPIGDNYILQVATSANFTGTVFSSMTVLLTATVPALSPNTTYYGRVDALIYSASSSWTSAVPTATLANIPGTAVSTWTYVGYSSVTLTWSSNSNPTGVTRYEVYLSTASDFLAEETFSTTTMQLFATFQDLNLNTVYYAQVRAINHSDVLTSFQTLGSTQTISPTMCNASATGNWSAAGTWTGCTGVGGLPAATDAITVNAGITVTLNQNATVAGLNFAAPGANSALIHSGTFVLLVNGDATFNQPTTTGRNNNWNIDAGSATVTGRIMFNGTSTTGSRISRITITTGQLNALDGMYFQGTSPNTKQIIMSGGAGTLNLQGPLSFAGTSGTLSPGTLSAFNYNDNVSAQTVQFFSSGTYNHLYLNNTSAAGVSLGAAISTGNVAGDLRVQSGTLKNAGFAIVGNTGFEFQVTEGASLEMSGTSSFPSGFTTRTLGSSSTVRFKQTTPTLDIPSFTYGNLELVPAASATQRFPAGSLTVLGSLLIGDGSNATTVRADTNLTLLSVGGAFTIANNASFTANATNVLTVGGNWTNGGTFNANASTVVFSGGAVQQLAGATIFSGMQSLQSGTTLQFQAGTTFYVTLFVDFENAALRSTSNGALWYFNFSGSSQTLRNLIVQDSYAGNGQLMNCASVSIDAGNNTNWDFGAPSAVLTLASNPGTYGATIQLLWQTPGDDGSVGTLTSSSFTIQYTSNAAFAQSTSWDPINAQPSDVYRITLSTTALSPADTVSSVVPALVSGSTYYFRLWTFDNVGNYSTISNGATNYATPVNLSIELSTDTLDFGKLDPNAVVLISTPIVVTNNGNVNANYVFRTTTTAEEWPWQIGPTQDIDQYVLWMVTDQTEPQSSDFGNEDMLSASDVSCTSNIFAKGGNICVSVPPGEQRTFWFKIGLPPVVHTDKEQQIRLVGTAEQAL